MILIQWIDSCSYEGWQNDLSECVLVKSESIGYLVEQTKDSYKLAGTKTLLEHYMPFADVTCIPKKAVLKIRFLK